MKYAHEVMDLMGAYPGRSFRVGELVRHVTHGRTLAARERDAVRKAIQRVLDALLSAGSIQVTEAAEQRGGFFSYSVSHKWDIAPPKVGQEVRHYVRAPAP